MTKTDALLPSTAETMLTMSIAEHLYAVPISTVEEVLPNLPLEPMPQCPAFIKGIVFVRGHLIPVLDAAERLGLARPQPPADPHLVCLRVGDRLVAVEVDEALDLIQIDPRTITTAARLEARGGFFQGLIEREGTVIRVLDPQRLLTTAEDAGLQPLAQT